MKNIKIFTIILSLTAVLATGCTGSQQRGIKSFKSNMVGGLDRTVTVYDYNGKPIKQWTGKIDIAESETKTDFIVDGKKVVIHGGITIVEEK